MHSKKYQNLPTVFGWRFKGNEQVSMGNLRETEISISPLGNCGKLVCFPKISPTKNVVKFHNFLQWWKMLFLMFLCASRSSYFSNCHKMSSYGVKVMKLCNSNSTIFEEPLPMTSTTLYGSFLSIRVEKQ